MRWWGWALIGAGVTAVIVVVIVVVLIVKVGFVNWDEHPTP